MNRNTYRLALLIVLVAAASGSSSYLLARRHQDVAANTTTTAPAPTQAERKVMYWYDPMMPNQHFDKPGKSPFMDMPLLPKYAEDAGDAAGIKIDPGIVQNLGMRTVKVERGSLAPTIDAVASVQLNDRQVAIVQARSSGFVERVYARAPGDVVARGAPLVDLLVPEWAGAQGEFLAMMKSGDQSLRQAARERLKLLGMPSALIARIENSGQPQPIVTITAPIAGLIQSLDIRTGMTVVSGAPLARINGLDTVWLEAAIPEAMAGRVTVNRRLLAHFAAYPGENFSGKVLAVLPETNADSRTLRVRVELPNRDGRLKPGMYAQIRLDTGNGASALLVPSEAVIRTGTRSIVLLALEGGRYQPVEVRLGQEADGKIAVLDGLREGQSIVASGQFLIDSEASLKGVMARLNDSSANTSAPPAPSAGTTPLNEAVGRIEAIKGDDMTLSHDAVPTLGWAPMTMPFKLARPELAASFAVGDSVRFAFREHDGQYVIEKLVRNGGQP